MKRLMLYLPILIFFIFLKPIYANSKYLFSNPNQIYVSGWKPSRRSSEEIRANFKTIDTLRKIKKLRRLKPYFKEAKGYAVFPNIGKLGIGFGGARGTGEVFEDGKVIGSAILTQLTVGFQLGAQTYSQIIFFQNQRDLDRFTDGNFEFGASASAALITEGANASADYSNGVAVMTFSKGGLMYEVSIGGQKFTFTSY